MIILMTAYVIRVITVRLFQAIDLGRSTLTLKDFDLQLHWIRQFG